MSHVVPPLLLGRISKCGYLLQIECQTVRINAKMQDIGASGLCKPDQGSFEELQNRRFAKKVSHGSRAPTLCYWDLVG